MPIELKMPALSPTMEEGTLAKWLVKEGDEVKSGDILAEIETDKATMEFEAVDEGTIAKILVPEGTDGVKVGAPIAILAGEGEDAGKAAAATPKADTAAPPSLKAPPAPKADETPKAPPAPQSSRSAARPGCAAGACRRSSSGARRGRTHQGLAARAASRRGAGDRPCDPQGFRPGRADRPRRYRRRGRQNRDSPLARDRPQPLRGPRRSQSRPKSRTSRSSSPTCARRSPVA